TLSTLSTDYILFYDTSISKHFSLSLHDALPIYKSRLQAEYKIVVPKKFNLDLKTAGGHIKIGDLEGEAKAVTAGGALKFGNIQGAVQGRTAGGEITLASASSTVNVNTAGGRIELGELQGETIATTAGG